MIGEACHHPVDVCMTLGQKPGIFDHHPVIHALTCEEALATLQRAAEAGLVHTVSNTRQEISYICNCCTCACGILRGVAELGALNAVAHSAFINQVDEALCIGCEICVEACQFQALALENFVIAVNQLRCVGCGVCVSSCQEGALGLVHRSSEDTLPVPANDADWRIQRSQARGIDINRVL
jgi:ferredoxin